MASGWNGSGTVVLTDGTYSTTWAASWAGDGDPKIKSSEFDLLLQCVEDSIQNCLPHDGQKAATADIPMGGNNITGLGTPSSSDDAGLHGADVASGAYSAVADEITLTLNDATTITIDTSALSAGTGGVALTGDQDITGAKAFTELKFEGPTKSLVDVPTPGSSVTVDTTAANAHYLTVGTNTNLTFTWPTAASDSQLGTHWSITGKVLIRMSGSYTVTLNATMLAALDDYEEEGSAASGSGEISTLVYSFYYLNGTKYAQFAWVSTP
jgi:hypothetical protein